MDNPSDARVTQLLRGAHRIAVVGLSSNPERPSYNVAYYLIEHGYEIIPVNPNEYEVLGRPAYARLTDVPGHVDIVSIFRRPIAVPDVVRAAIDVDAEAVWMQLGAYNEAAARQSAAAGLLTIANCCIAVEHARLVVHGMRIA
jgi:predicted CoA-binding protein